MSETNTLPETKKPSALATARGLIPVAAILALVGVIAYLMFSEQWLVNQYHRKFYLSPDTWARNKWLGVTCYQNPNDAWITQEIIAEVKPDFFVETGTAHGGGALLWASILSQVNPAGRVLTIDIDDTHLGPARRVPLWNEKVDFLHGSSTDPKVLAEVARRVEGKKVVVLLDSLHTRQHVFEELKAYAKFVPVGSYLIVQDSNLNGHPVRTYETEASLKFGPLGPYEAIDDFLATTDQFVPDRDRERLLLCLHPRGYLKRVK